MLREIENKMGRDAGTGASLFNMKISTLEIRANSQLDPMFQTLCGFSGKDVDLVTMMLIGWCLIHSRFCRVIHIRVTGVYRHCFLTRYRVGEGGVPN